MSDWATIRDRLGLTLRPIDEWPGRRTYDHERSPFSAPFRQTLTILERELRNLNARGIVLQIALREGGFRLDGLPRADARAEHPGVMLSFTSKHGPLRLHMDRFRDWRENLRAVADHLEHLRHAGLYGVGEDGQQYRGWTALPEPEPDTAESLIRRAAGVSNGNLRDAYREAVRRSHPDAGGDAELLRQIIEAGKQAGVAA